VETKVIQQVTDGKGKNPPHNPYKKVLWSDGTSNNLFMDSPLVAVAVANVGYPVEVTFSQNGKYQNVDHIEPLPDAEKATQTPQTAIQNAATSPMGQLPYLYSLAAKREDMDTPAKAAKYANVLYDEYKKKHDTEMALDIAADTGDVDLGDDIPF